MTTFAEDDDEFSPAITTLGALFDIALAAACIIMPVVHWSEVSRCQTPIVLWLYVSAGLFVVKCIKAMIFAWIVKTRRKDHFLKFAFDVFCLCFITAFELGWLIYAHTFQFSISGMDCKSLTSSSGVWYLVMFIMGLGYFSALHVILIIIRITCAYRKKNKISQVQQDPAKSLNTELPINSSPVADVAITPRSFFYQGGS